MSNTLYPWGGTEYLQKRGYINLDIFLQKYIPSVVIKIIGNHAEISFVRSGRDNYNRNPKKITS